MIAPGLSGAVVLFVLGLVGRGRHVQSHNGRAVDLITLHIILSVSQEQTHCNGFHNRVAKQQLCKHSPTRNNE
jgi:hypothetical protein